MKPGTKSQLDEMISIRQALEMLIKSMATIDRVSAQCKAAVRLETGRREKAEMTAKAWKIAAERIASMMRQLVGTESHPDPEHEYQIAMAELRSGGKLKL